MGLICGTINCRGGYYCFIFQKNLLALILSVVSALCVCMYIFGVVSIVVFVFCTLLSFAHRAPLKISIRLLSGPPVTEWTPCLG